MEERPIFPSPEDDDDEDEDEDGSSKKKRRLAGALLNLEEKPEKEEDQEDSKQSLIKEIARAIVEMRLRKEQEAENRPETAESDNTYLAAEEEYEATTGQEELSSEEEVYVNRAIANEHLENPITEQKPEEPVTDFLERVVEGVDPEEAYDETVDEHDLAADRQNLETEEPASTSAPQPEATITADSESEVKEDGELIIAHSEETYVPTPTRVVQTKAEVPKAPAVTTRRVERVKTIVKPSLGYNAGKRAGEAKIKREVKPRQKALEKKVASMEQNLEGQELSIQRLTQESKEIKAKIRESRPVERATRANQESRLDLVKPERIEHIGRVVVRAERPSQKATKEKVAGLKRIRPEDVKTMRREDLMIVSEKIIIEGASLKDMFENNLFSEKALRRLISEHLKGKDIRPLVRREIVEHEIDFERDPILRDRNREGYSSEEKESLFDKMLESAGTKKESSVNRSKDEDKQRPTKTPSLLKTKNDKEAKKTVGKSPSNTSIAVIIAILIAVIIVLLLRRRF